MGEYLARRRGLRYTLFLSIMKYKYKERGTHFGVYMDIIVLIVATKSSTSSIMLQYLTPRFFAQLSNNNNTKIMEPFLS
jgi:hypothetical protein